VKIVETAWELFQVLEEKDTVHLRRGRGRDDALYTDLRRLLGCPEDAGLASWLKGSKVSAQAFLAAFFAAAQPLSLMYRDIYEGMLKAHVMGAAELVRVHIEDDDAAFDLDLGDFAKIVPYLEKRLERRTVLLWDARSVNELTDVVGNLLGVWRFRGPSCGGRSQVGDQRESEGHDRSSGRRLDSPAHVRARRRRPRQV
jgi:hypothetical protein